MTALNVLLRYTLRALLRGRRLVAPLLLALVPVLLSLLLVALRARFDVRGLSPAAIFEQLAIYYYHLLVILVAMLFATSAVADDAEDGSLVFLLVRPIRRGAVFLGKVAAAGVATIATVAPSMLLSFGVLSLSAESGELAVSLLLRDLAWLGLAAIGYSAVFAAAGTVGRRPLQFATLWLVLWEGMLAVAPTRLRFFTVTHYVLSLMPHPSPWNGLVTMFGMVSSAPVAVAGVLAMTVALLGLGAAWYERKEQIGGAEPV